MDHPQNTFFVIMLREKKNLFWKSSAYKSKYTLTPLLIQHMVHYLSFLNQASLPGFVWAYNSAQLPGQRKKSTLRYFLEILVHTKQNIPFIWTPIGPKYGVSCLNNEVSVHGLVLLIQLSWFDILTWFDFSGIVYLVLQFTWWRKFTNINLTSRFPISPVGKNFTQITCLGEIMSIENTSYFSYVFNI